MQLNYTLSGSIIVPEGSKLNETRSGIILPDGRTLKLWEALELNDTDDGTCEDISFDQAAEMGIHYDGDVCRFEEA